MMKNKGFKLVIILLIALLVGSGFLGAGSFKIARADNRVQRIGVNVNYEKNIAVYTDLGELLFERTGVVVGDFYINKDYMKYEVVEVDYNKGVGFAKFVEIVEKPKVFLSDKPSKINTENRKIGLYCTHNDESYLPTDGYYTIYGHGGIHDVAKSVKASFENMGVEVFLDETLHIPHDSLAYSRSSATAKNLLKNNLDAMFDLHRDGTARSFYATTANGREYSRIRIVVGMANSNRKANEEFALYLSAVADELYPWLISDIYYATGHYNQNLFSKNLLFEMGTHLIEKELVLRSVDPLVHVVNVALFGTTINDEGDLEIGGQPDENNILITDKLEENKKALTMSQIIIYIVLVLLSAFIFAGIVITVYLGFIKPRFIKQD